MKGEHKLLEEPIATMAKTVILTREIVLVIISCKTNKHSSWKILHNPAEVRFGASSTLTLKLLL